MHPRGGGFGCADQRAGTRGGAPLEEVTQQAVELLLHHLEHVFRNGASLLPQLQFNVFVALDPLPALDNGNKEIDRLVSRQEHSLTFYDHVFYYLCL